MEPLQTPKNLIKNSKSKENPENPENWGPLFSYDRESPIGPRWVGGMGAARCKCAAAANCCHLPACQITSTQLLTPMLTPMPPNPHARLQA